MHLPETLSNEHYQKLYRLQDEVLAFIEDSNPVFYPGGGTALSFHADELEKARWLSPIRIEQFVRDREIIVQNIITKEDNQISTGCFTSKLLIKCLCNV